MAVWNEGMLAGQTDFGAGADAGALEQGEVQAAVVSPEVDAQGGG